MADMIPQSPIESTPKSLVRPQTPATTAETEARSGRYDANVQLILRRLADHQNDAKPRRWWLGG